MIEVKIEAPDLPIIQQWTPRLHWAVARLIAREAEETARDFKQEMADQGIAATSLMINSVKADRVDDLTWRVGPHVEYARYVLEGRRPGGKFPPWQKIADWLRVRRMDSSRSAAWAVARAIQRRGIKKRDYLTPVVNRTRDRLAARAPDVISEALTGHVG